MTNDKYFTLCKVTVDTGMRIVPELFLKIGKIMCLFIIKAEDQRR